MTRTSTIGRTSTRSVAWRTSCSRAGRRSSASSPAKLLGAHLGETPRDIRELRADVPPALADLVMRSLAKDPDHRPGQASDLVRVLDSVTSSGASTAAPAILAPTDPRPGARWRCGPAQRRWSG